MCFRYKITNLNSFPIIRCAEISNSKWQFQISGQNFLFLIFLKIQNIDYSSIADNLSNREIHLLQGYCFFSGCLRKIVLVIFSLDFTNQTLKCDDKDICCWTYYILLSSRFIIDPNVIEISILRFSVKRGIKKIKRCKKEHCLAHVLNITFNK